VSLAVDALLEPLVDLLGMIDLPLNESQRFSVLLKGGLLLLSPQLGICIFGYPWTLDEQTGVELPIPPNDVVCYSMQLGRTAWDIGCMIFDAFTPVKDWTKVVASGLAFLHMLAILKTAGDELSAIGLENNEADRNKRYLSAMKLGMNFFGVAPGLLKFCGHKTLVEASSGISAAVLVGVDVLSNAIASGLSIQFILENAKSLPDRASTGTAGVLSVA
jgi:hypothetical protein